MRVLLFDLDNTLYPEVEFVRSGFRRVAQYINYRYNIDENVIFERMIEILETEGRGRVFDTLLHEQNLYTKERVMLLVHLYRSHDPIIRPYNDVLPFLELMKTRGIRLGILSDGMASVQRKKIASLDLERFLDVVICTDELGSEYWKPSLTPYVIALEFLGASPLESVYVGDDLSKDFLAPNSLGMMSIRIDRGEENGSKMIEVCETSLPRLNVRGLGEIEQILESESDVIE